MQRVLIHRSHIRAFTEALVRITEERAQYGDPAEEGVWLSAMIDDRAREKVTGLIRAAKDDGAVVEYEGPREGNLLGPVVLSRLPESTALRRTEAFGPVVYLDIFDDDAEAIAKINASRFGLQAGLYTQHQKRIDRYFRQLQVGALIVDDIPTFRADHMPYGGIKDSGRGREGLRYAFEEYTEQRLLVLPKFGPPQ